jgi:predicted aconitase
MYHIPSMTPEAPTLEAAFQGKKPKETVAITKADLKRVYELMNYGDSTDVDFVYLGCPHYNIEEIRKVADLLEGKKCKTRFWVGTNPPTYKTAVLAGYRKRIEVIVNGDKGTVEVVKGQNNRRRAFKYRVLPLFRVAVLRCSGPSPSENNSSS